MADDDQNEKYRAPALDKGLDILELLSETQEGLSQGEISKALNRTPNEIYRMLERLVRRDYVVRTANDSYELTLKLFALAHRHPPMHRLISRATPMMRRFARASGQAAHLVVFDRGNVVVIAQVDAPGYWSLAIKVGSHIGLMNTGSGHVLLAFARDEERRLMIEEHERMPHEQAPDDLDQILELVRQRGYEARASQQISAVQNLSVPVMGSEGRVLAALTCPFVERIDSAAAPKRDDVLALVIELGQDLSRTMTALEASDRT
ncbi:IclR family transcriptional regulator [Kaistia dalseonensis]|uniref:DNA-binding IclR family transcriptional regulator n=1 Tax=Kaistia dalseonensis TaxID=410840 RepID=A0ABU0H277_9HYPH|nr:IclR family transcriptional regulator [Kaistia dalseonensis]MCX5493323.1 IclR family transcriptional regulator [Kaistia dalseonensis]MDQ0435880.1 DNA-binding IclR family transcriptional regulator [Kaistia dalseonensis]